MLIATALWSALITFVHATERLSQPGGNAWAFGNRDTPLTVPAWVDRAVRAHHNLTENPTVAAVIPDSSVLETHCFHIVAR